MLRSLWLLAVSLAVTQLDGVSGFLLQGSGPAPRSAAWTKVGAHATGSKVESLTVTPINRVTGTIQLPGSKSLSNRALLLAALAEGETVVENLLDSDDITYMLKVKGHWGGLMCLV